MNAKKPKRLAKACDNCHRGKRKCDGTGPCSTCFYAGKTCIYTSNLGAQIPPPVQPHDDLQKIINKVDLNQREYAILTYRTTTSAAEYVAAQQSPTPSPQVHPQYPFPPSTSSSPSSAGSLLLERCSDPEPYALDPSGYPVYQQPQPQNQQYFHNQYL